MENEVLIKVIMGYLVVINIISISIEWLSIRTDIFKDKEKKLNIAYVFLSLIGGFVGVLVGADMLGIRRENKLLKRWIPFMIFIELVIIGSIIYSNYR